MILYYSRYCDKCKSLLSRLHTSEWRDKLRYVCIDSRTKEGDGKIAIILQNGFKLYLPPCVNKVPALYDENMNKCLIGQEILDYMFPPNKEIQRVNEAVNADPDAYGGIISSGGFNSYGVMSDSFSFLNQSADEMSAKGDGGTKQMYNYCSINDNASINTPIDNETSDKIGNVSLENLEQMRNNDISFIK